MSEGRMNNWIRTSLLLGALAAGIVTTQLMPNYQEAARTITYPSQATPVTNARSNAAGDVSGVDVDHGHMKLVRTKS